MSRVEIAYLGARYGVVVRDEFGSLSLSIADRPFCFGDLTVRVQSDTPLSGDGKANLTIQGEIGRALIASLVETTRPPTGAKWTRGELDRIVEENDTESAIEVLKYLVERGPRVVDWDDERAPCEECDCVPSRHAKWCSRSSEVQP